jgi:glycerol-3-phosphate dehydrogenase subunit C
VGGLEGRPHDRRALGAFRSSRKETAMSEGSLGAPVRHPIAWQDPDFYDMAKIEAECHRVFDICHGCRRCFNLCDSFPRLFDLVDNSSTEEMDGVATADYKKVVDACTLCDM